MRLGQTRHRPRGASPLVGGDVQIGAEAVDPLGVEIDHVLVALPLDRRCRLVGVEPRGLVAGEQLVEVEHGRVLSGNAKAAARPGLQGAGTIRLKGWARRGAAREARRVPGMWVVDLMWGGGGGFSRWGF